MQPSFATVNSAAPPASSATNIGSSDLGAIGVAENDVRENPEVRHRATMTPRHALRLRARAMFRFAVWLVVSAGLSTGAVFSWNLPHASAQENAGRIAADQDSGKQRGAPPQRANDSDAEPANASTIDPAELLFVRRVQPLLQEKCLACHGNDAEKIEGGLDLRSRAVMLRGGDSGERAAVDGRPDASPIFLAVKRNHDDWSAMPPKEADGLNDEQIEWIRAWIAGGSPWPDAARTSTILSMFADKWSAEDGVPVVTSGGLNEDWTSRRYKPDGLWAYRPVVKPGVDVAGGAAVDALIAARIPDGLIAAPPADRQTLIRRVTFDLTGLPPSPEEVAAFRDDPRSDAEAFAAVVDRLLESPHYGERMAQHWLDVVRYADSSGFANDYARGNAWRYRDYVVRSFNSDKPYDQFVREQIAGDEIDPGDPEMRVAVGFLRMGPWELTGMEVARIARQRFLDDVTNSVGETFLAHSLQCARCHDHKFDPIPTRDYYSVQAVFATTQLTERDAAFLPSENVEGFDERRFLERRLDSHFETLARLDAKALEAADRWFAERDVDDAAWRAAVRAASNDPPNARQRRTVFDQARNAMLRQGVSEDLFPPRMLGWTPEDMGMERIARKGIERLRWELETYEAYALSVYNGRTPDVKSVNSPTRIPGDRLKNGDIETPCILIGGDPFSRGEAVEPGVLSIVESLGRVDESLGSPVAIPGEIEGRRRAFAEWVASPSNPLTTRAIVNRIWLWHFNQPIAGNPNNFGSTGKKPTHPELLDWLAATLVEEGWSLKSLHRIILNSETYRRSGIHPDLESLAERDPLGASLAAFPPRRLSAEELRDAILTASGELNRRLGGIPVRPEINQEAALQPRMVMGTFADAWTPNPIPSQRHRRTLYALKLRGLADPMLEVFNAPQPDFSCERRETSTVTPQVFSLFNGHSTHARALALAARAAADIQRREEEKSIPPSSSDITPSNSNRENPRGPRATDRDSWDEQVLRRCFWLAYSRPPTRNELDACREHWRAVESSLPDVPTATEPPPLTVRRDAVEENSGERFSYEEPLYSNAEFVPDLQPADVSKHVRALADVCLVLLNSNEFLYVY